MVSLKQVFIMKKSILKYSIFLLLTWPLLSCEDDEGGALFTDVPVTTEIDGPEEVEIASTGVTYSVSQRVGSTYTWSVTGAEIAEASTSGAVKINFTTQFPAPTDPAVITVVETDERGAQGEARTLEVVIEVSQPSASIISATSLPLKEGSSDFVVAVFHKPLQTAPEFDVLSVSGLPEKGTLSATTGTLMTAADTVSMFTSLAVRSIFRDNGPAGDVYYTEFTSGPGNAGAARIGISDAVATELHGGLTMKAAAGSINRIDNAGASAAIGFSSSFVKVGDDDVEITVTFNEELDTLNTVFIEFASVGGIPALPATAMTPTLDDDGNFADSKVWKFKYAVEDGNGVPDFILSGGTDIAGNPVVGPVSNASKTFLTIDNIAPLTSNESGDQINAEFFASLAVDSNEDGMVYYAVVADGADPKVSEIVSGDPSVVILNGSKSVDAGATASFTTQVLDPDEYDVYFVIEDDAGNLSLRSGKVDLSIN